MFDEMWLSDSHSFCMMEIDGIECKSCKWCGTLHNMAEADKSRR